MAQSSETNVANDLSPKPALPSAPLISTASHITQDHIASGAHVVVDTVLCLASDRCGVAITLQLAPFLEMLRAPMPGLQCADVLNPTVREGVAIIP